MMRCGRCGEIILDGEAFGVEEAGVSAPLFHRECFTRLVAGSVGHQLGLCSCPRGLAVMDDPRGLSDRDAAIAAADLARRLSSLAEGARPAAVAEAASLVRLLGHSALSSWHPLPGPN